MRSSRNMIARMMAQKNREKKNRNRIVAISIVIVFAIISLTVTPAITLVGNSGEKYLDDLSSKPALQAMEGQVGEANYIEPSSSIQGVQSFNGRPWNYSSDPGSSKIEAMFTGVASDDGKVLADKSVTYGKDDYNAFNSYENGTFGVSLSALAQQYNIFNGEKVDIPADVVFIMDTSGSMKANKVGEVTRAEIMVNSINPAIRQIMTLNPNNRIGIVNFSDGASNFLALDRYTTGDVNNKYLWYTEYGEIETVEGGIKDSKGQVIQRSTVNQSELRNWSGTYTQAGIAYANNMLQQNANTTYTDSNGYTVKRKPVVILLSDGEPTYCTSNYNDVLNGPHYGNGYSATPSNNQGVLGYYTILSANYYKGEIGRHYGRDSGFYTIGMGINETGEGSATSGSITGDDYKRTVLDPTPENIVSLMNSTAYYNEYTGLQMCHLLNDEYGYSTIVVDNAYVEPLGWTNKDVPVISNPYKDTGYNYSESSYFGNMTEEQLNEVFNSIIQEIVDKVEYGFAVIQNTSVNITDPIGLGMEVKGAPVLRYNGKNYVYTSQVEDNSSGSLVKKYTYKYTASDDNTSRTTNLEQIDVRVTTDSIGNQVVSMSVPDNCMPVYAFDRYKGVYCEDLPIRLIYKVGLTKQAMSNAKNGDLFYTNRWDGHTAKAELYPRINNPYYLDGGGYVNNSVNKTENATETIGTSSSSIKENSKIVITLGNNGRLVAGEEKANIAIEVIKRWQDVNGVYVSDVSLMPGVTVTLYRKTGVEGATAQYVEQSILNNSNGWKTIFNELPSKDERGDPFVYYVEENPVDGYTTMVGSSVTLEDGTITVTNRAIPEEGTITIRKVWQNYFGNPIQDTSLFPHINAELWRHVSYTDLDPVSLTISYGGETEVIKVPPGTDVTFYVRAYYYGDWANFSQIYKDGKPTDDVETDTSTDREQSSIRTTSLQTITVNNDMTVTYYSLSPDYGNSIYANSLELLNLEYVQPGIGEVTAAPDELYESVVLNQNNNWQKFWSDIPTEEVKDAKTYTYKYYLKEISVVPGYDTTYSAENSVGIEAGTLEIINKSKTAMDVLPKTGGKGTRKYSTLGISLIVFATFVCIYRKKKWWG
ncbi:LPXTG-motif cell wall anchor domain-containing protein [Hathewaya proteolytica DSM 3090]|uniref:LPXTG-motif cell wall anchor domain-containing protein n=1 Tax=Hathewaya proteolytica DSM 3090 TaxID=1121331 RepID=A0A1M6MHV9_9CLOT|nr:Cna B-type domain-containing protein [Hathewaya proteolytica]SHJ83048.1 LPXTG-motif cell wall anchor domain-containing protein [Hathewaya proteolytica DSM 3090]